MKHIKLFNTDAQYQEFASDAAQPIPNVSYVTETDEVHYNESDPILFAYEYRADKFVMGVVIGSDIYVDTYETGFIVADGSGKFSTALAYTNDDLINIQNAIKDHYHLAASTIKTKAPLIEYAVGDTVPNWNAYEKIEMPETKQYLAIKYDEYAAGYLENENVYLYGYTSSGNIIICSDEGFVYQGGEVLSEEVRMILNSKLQNAGIQFNEIIVVQSPYAYGETIENWDNYQKIS